MNAGNSLVIVESPAKGKTIEKYLGPGYRVLASYGHVRDLIEKDSAVEPDKDFAMHWEVQDRGRKAIGEIAKSLKEADRLYLATDPDREGEAISWHLLQVLREANKLGKIDVKRVVFNEITKKAVLTAMTEARDINQELVDAYLARRALDFLVGYTLSPVLWRRMPGSRSAGRVQSVALRLICEREAEIERFKAREYWTVDAALQTPAGQPFSARLTHLDGRKLDKFDLADKEAAEAAAKAVQDGRHAVATIERKRVRRNPQAPFTTSTLQQEASRKLGLGASQTMRLAQRLYEGVDIGGETVGLITYMRTDSVTLSQEAIAAARDLIGKRYGRDYVPEAPRVWKTQAKNAQEAHEAIRPTDLFRTPEELRGHVDGDMLRLYELVWRRTMASEMESAALDQVAVDIDADGGRTRLRATGSTIVFDGFLALYREDRDDPTEDDEDNRMLPAMAEGDALRLDAVKPEQHFTQPPPRYSEASLVKRLEELGIGRPSTYASILQVLQDRGYVRLEKRRFIPEDLGRMVTAFLTSFFDAYFQYDFTAKLEDQLDEISGGRADWKAVMRAFWEDFSRKPADQTPLPAVKQAVDTLIENVGTIRDVIDRVNAELGPHFFPDDGSGRDPRACPACAEGKLGIKFSRNGAFIGCSNYPECRYTRNLAVVSQDEAAAAATGPKVIGVDPITREVVSLRDGRFGMYIQLGEGAEDEKPRRVSLPRDVPAAELDLETALKLLALPREVGKHPESAEPIMAGLGRFGPYIVHKGSYRNLETTHDLLTIGLNRAVDLMAQPNKSRRRAGPPSLRQVGAHPEDGKPIEAGQGRFGPFVKHGKVYASLPKGKTVEEVTLDEAVTLIEERIAKGGGKAKAKTRAPKAAKAKAPRAKARKAKVPAQAEEDAG